MADRALSNRPIFRIAVVCTANQCRSVMAEKLWGEQFRAAAALPEFDIRLTSAGVMAPGQPATPRTVKVLAERGFDASEHRSRQIGPWLAASDLIVTMTFEQLRAVVANDATLWPRTFALRQLARRSASARPRLADQNPSDWVAQLHEGRTVRDTVGEVALDVDDPTGHSMRRHRELAEEFDVVFHRLTELLAGRHS